MRRRKALVDQSRTSSETLFPSPGIWQSIYRHPWLMYLHGENAQPQSFCDISSPSRDITVKNIPEFCERVPMYCSPDGKRLLLARFTPSGFPGFLVWSPMSQESILLPCLRRSGLWDRGMQGLLSSTSSLVFLFFTNSPLILYCRIGDKKWIEFNYAQSIEAQIGEPLKPDYYLCGAVDFNGTVYATASCYRDLVEISVDDDNNQCETRLLLPEDQSRHLHNRSRQSLTPNCRNILVSLGGQVLGQIIISPVTFNRYREALSISIFKFDFSSNCWQEMTSLNGGAVFLCTEYALYSSQGAPMDVGLNSRQWSYIYFTFETDETLFSYRVEDEKVSSYSIFPPNQHWPSFWIMPAMPDGECFPEHDDGTVTVEVTMADFWKHCRRRSTNAKRRRLMTLKNESLMPAEDDEKLPLFDCLSKEVLASIAENLCFVDYMHFRSVNKLCASGTIRMRLNTFPPSLMYKDGVNGVYNMVDSNLKHKLSIKVPEGLENYVILCSRNGWLLLGYERDLAFFNPMTMQVLSAGYAPRRHWVLNYTFISKPSSFDCSILVMSHGSWDRYLFFVKPFSEAGNPTHKKLAVGGGGGANVGDGGLEEFLFQGCNNPVVLRDLCYYLGDNGMLGRFQLTQDEEYAFPWQVYEDLIVPGVKSFGRNYLTECGGELVSVFLGDDGDEDQGKPPWVRVFKLKDHKEWEEIDTLGGYCLYLGRTTSTSCIAEAPNVADRIYFQRFFEDELIYYSLSTKTHHSVGSQHELQSLNGTTFYLDCAWFEPNWS